MTEFTTYLGIALDPLTPKAECIEIKDIAHALSLICRANGHFPRFYSVAQHCVNCVYEAKARGYSEREQLACLLHDASEAYLSDITRPVKKKLTQYQKFEKNMQTVIYQKFLTSPLTPEEADRVSEVDDTLLHHEFWMISGRKIFDTEPTLYANLCFDFVDFATVEQQFLQLFDQLYKN